MRALIQRTQRASVTISEKLHSSIGKGLLILLGIEEADTQESVVVEPETVEEPEQSTEAQDNK